jgi:hypothetical protein
MHKEHGAVLQMETKRLRHDELTGIPAWGDKRQQEKRLNEAADQISRRLRWLQQTDPPPPITYESARTQLKTILANIPPAFYMQLFQKMHKAQARQLSKVLGSENEHAADALQRRLRL